MFLLFGLIIAGLLVLVFGATVLVRGASGLAAAMGLSPLVIGLTVVAFGTSAPELAVGIKASLSGHADIAVGNVVGSNIANIMFILGASALVAPLLVSSRLVRLDVPALIAASALTWFFCLDGVVTTVEGMVLTALFFAYIGLQLVLGRKEAKADSGGETEAPVHGSLLFSTAQIIVGLGCLILGSEWLVDGATGLAKAMEMSELVIGLTVVAMGTSFPELATSIIASMNNERDIAVGNVVGSCLFNLLCILGMTSIVSPTGVVVAQQVIGFDLPIMVGAAVVCLPIFITGSIISRWEGALLLGAYILYTVLLVLKATGNPYFIHLSHLAVYLVLPLAAFFLLASLTKTLFKVSRFAALLGDEFDAVYQATFLRVRRLVIFVTGMTVLLVGVIMIFLPAPAILVIPLGLTILATEFAWAKRLLIKVQTKLRKAFPSVAAKLFDHGQ